MLVFIFFSPCAPAWLSVARKNFRAQDAMHAQSLERGKACFVLLCPPARVSEAHKLFQPTMHLIYSDIVIMYISSNDHLRPCWSMNTKSYTQTRNATVTSHYTNVI